MKKTLDRILSTLLALCLLCMAVPMALAASDAEGHWAEADLRAFADAGYLDGDGKGNYYPNEVMRRAQFAALVNRIKGFTAESSKVGSYSDVDPAAWYYADIAKALAAGYLQGNGDKMRPDTAITRQEAFVIVARLIGLDGASADLTALDKFVDGEDVAPWARPELAAMVEAGFVEGGSQGRLKPGDELTRAEGVTVLARALDVLTSTVTVNDSVYAFSTDPSELARAVQIADTGVYYVLRSGEGLSGTLYGTADLKYADFYAGDVTSTEDFDAVTSATNSKHSIMGGIYSDFVDAEANADGYHILGVKDVSVAVDAKVYVEAVILKAAGKLEGELYEKAADITLNDDATDVPAQYKTLNADGSYSDTVFNVADTVTEAKAELVTGSNWGDYQINVTDPEGVTYLRNTRSDEGFAINSKIQGIILETSSGLKVGLEYLQSIWVQPYELSFNVESVNTGNQHIAKWDNLTELSKLLGETVTKITYIMPGSAYVYEFDGIYIKPVYEGAVVGSFNEDYDTFTFSAMPEGLEDAQVTVKFTVGAGRNRQDYVLYTGELAEVLTLDRSVIPGGSEGAYSVTIASSNYADIVADYPMTAEQRAQLETLIKAAEVHLDDPSVKEHHDEAVALLADENATSTATTELIGELKSHLSVYTDR